MGPGGLDLAIDHSVVSVVVEFQLTHQVALAVVSVRKDTAEHVNERLLTGRSLEMLREQKGDRVIEGIVGFRFAGETASIASGCPAGRIPLSCRVV
jgi:hypothetical protein